MRRRQPQMTTLPQRRRIPTTSKARTFATAPIIRTPDARYRSRRLRTKRVFMTPAPSLSESAFTERCSAVGRAASSLVAAVFTRLFRRAATAVSDGPLLAQNGRGDGPPDLDELWRDFNRKLRGLFGRGGGSRGNGGGDPNGGCLLYTSDAADDLLCVDLGG